MLTRRFVEATKSFSPWSEFIAEFQRLSETNEWNEAKKNELSGGNSSSNPDLADTSISRLGLGPLRYCLRAEPVWERNRDARSIYFHNLGEGPTRARSSRGMYVSYPPTSYRISKQINKLHFSKAFSCGRRLDTSTKLFQQCVTSEDTLLRNQSNETSTQPNFTYLIKKSQQKNKAGRTSPHFTVKREILS